MAGLRLVLRRVLPKSVAFKGDAVLDLVEPGLYRTHRKRSWLPATRGYHALRFLGTKFLRPSEVDMRIVVYCRFSSELQNPIGKSSLRYYGATGMTTDMIE